MEIQLVEDMEIRNVTRDDLPRLAEIISCEELITREDICFEYSKLMTDDNDMIVSFVIIRQYSLNEFFNGEIPLYKCDKNSNDYKEGDEFWFIEMLDDWFALDNQYEILYAYSIDDYFLPELYDHIRVTDNHALGLLWATIHNPYITDDLKKWYFRKYNNDFLYDFVAWYH